MLNYEGNLEHVRNAIRSGADVNFVLDIEQHDLFTILGERRFPVLFLAVNSGDIDIINELIQSGAVQASNDNKNGHNQFLVTVS